MAERFYADEVEDYAQPLRSNHPEIADASIGYVFRDGMMRSGGEEIMGRATTVPDKYQAAMRHLSETDMVFDFIVEISFEMWRNANEKQKKAHLDHLLSMCQGEMQDDGTMKYKTRKPTIQTFPGVIKRHGAAFDPELVKLKNRLESSAPVEVESDTSVSEELMDD